MSSKAFCLGVKGDGQAGQRFGYRLGEDFSSAIVSVVILSLIWNGCRGLNRAERDQVSVQIRKKYVSVMGCRLIFGRQGEGRHDVAE